MTHAQVCVIFLVCELHGIQSFYRPPGRRSRLFTVFGILSRMNVILMHGKDANPMQKWYPWLARELAARHIPCSAPALPHADEPHIEEWKAMLTNLQPSQETILIGHSRGGVAVLRWLEDQPKELKVKCVILVATNSGLIKNQTVPGETNYGFYSEDGYDFPKILQHCNDFIILHSRDDKWVPYVQGIENAEGLHAKLLTFEDRGHFGKGINEIPELLEVILQSSS